MATRLVYASPRERAALAGLAPAWREGALETGVGKLAAGLSLASALSAHRPDAVVVFGVCGAYPARHLRGGRAPVELRSLCVVRDDRLVDEGVLMPDGFHDLGAMELGEIGPFTAELELSAKVAGVLDCPLVTGATVSTGAAVESLSEAYALRSGAQVETLEGAAVALACREHGVPWVQLRCVSNWTGDRRSSQWDLDGALAVLAEGLARVVAAGVLP